MTALASASKDELILAAIAALGGEDRDVNERDAFLTAWHAFPNTMRWTDTALPNPETFTAALRRLEQRAYIRRVGKQRRTGRGRPRSRRKTAVDPGRSGVVKARIVEDGLSKAGVSPDLVDQVLQLVPRAAAIRSLSNLALIALCAELRAEDGRHLDEGALVELAFHKFPSRFAYRDRPEFPDVGLIRQAISEAVAEGLLTPELSVTDRVRGDVDQWRKAVGLRLDASTAHATGDLKFAARIERSPAFTAFAEHGTLVRTKPDELFRMLRVPPTTDPKPVLDVLSSRLQALQRVDKGLVATYLTEVAKRHNPEVADLLLTSPPTVQRAT